MEYVFIGAVLLPITPEKIEISKPGKNQAVDLINDGEINIPHKRGLQTFTFDVILPSGQSYPFQNYRLNGREATAFCTYFDELQIRKLPFPFIHVSHRGKGQGGVLDITYTNVLCTIEEQSIVQDASNGQDHIVSLSLKEYREYGNESVKTATDVNGNVTYSVSRKSGKSYNAELNRLANEIVAKMGASGAAASLFRL